MYKEIMNFERINDNTYCVQESLLQINGETFKVPSGNITVKGDKIYCDGVLVKDTSASHEKNITIIITGNGNSISTTSGKITVKGNIGEVSTQSGDIEITGDVRGNCKTMSGDITVHGNIHGGCQSTSGDITAQRVVHETVYEEKKPDKKNKQSGNNDNMFT